MLDIVDIEMSIFLLLLILSPIIPGVISYFLNKSKIKLLKYLAPLVSLIISIIFYIQEAGFECGPSCIDSMGGFENIGNFLFKCSFGLGFFISLIYCINVDVTHTSKKRKK
jgi:uncharacterized membrane protein YdjX (TVP38/TMEM64 family)